MPLTPLSAAGKITSRQEWWPDRWRQRQRRLLDAEAPGDDDPVGPNDLHLHVGNLGDVDLAAQAQRELPLPTTLAVTRSDAWFLHDRP